MPIILDVAGTGASSNPTLNVSTAVAFITAATGFLTVKNCGAGRTSPVGSVDVLTALGITTIPTITTARNLLKRDGLVFVAPDGIKMQQKRFVSLDPHLRAVLSNPFGNDITHHMMGVGKPEWIDQIDALLKQEHPNRKYCLVNNQIGNDSYDEIGCYGDNRIHTSAGKDYIRTISMKQENVPEPNPIPSGDNNYNAAQILLFLNGNPGIFRDTVVENAAYAITLVSECRHLDAIRICEKMIDSGKAFDMLLKVRRAI